ncbi:uncharacterized protein M6B38_310765 [Iris pallida]|uniref:Transmembrane protein n=1 Tax=Iris pallida TaxID=29817 RepID=A0AAX6HHY9_IRIPA|nr:uncharacterized protein M6B38_310765 [Iris pallida]
MHRAASTSSIMSSATSVGVGVVGGGGGGGGGMEMEPLMQKMLPSYDPQSEVWKKEQAKARLAENMVHLIPVVLIVCALLLWFFSHP